MKQTHRACSRRRFLQAGGLALAGAALPGCLGPGRAPAPEGRILTVAGPVAPEALGLTLPHEHVLVDFGGAKLAATPRYDREQAYAAILPHLIEARRAGIRSFFECTPAYLGRDPALLVRLAEASGLRIVTNTGYYGARDDASLPEHAFAEDADALARRWTREFTHGIGETGIRPGFIKIGVDAGPLSAIDRKLVAAAARTHLATGLTIAAHTGPAAAAFEQLDVLRAEGVHPSAWIWVHAQAEQDAERHLEAGRRGAWVSFDGLAWEAAERYAERLERMRAADLLGRTLISHDAGWHRVGEAEQSYKPYTALTGGLLPLLRARGWTEGELRRLTVENPARAYTLGRKPA